MRAMRGFFDPKPYNGSGNLGKTGGGQLICPTADDRVNALPMHRIFQTFVDQLHESKSPTDLRDTMASAAKAMDLHSFAYLAMPDRQADTPQLISTYSSQWTTYYLRNRYERLDPVIVRARRATDPFDWGLGAGAVRMSEAQRNFFEEAAHFGIRYGFTVPIHKNHRGPIAAVTFAGDCKNVGLRRAIETNPRVLQLMAMFFHSHARRKLAPKPADCGNLLSPRETECLEWAAEGKTAWEIGRVLGISRRTAAFHLENAKAKFGVHAIGQAIAKFTAAKTHL